MQDRLCKVCSSAEVEDEFHALLKCGAYQNIRDNMFYEISATLPDFNNFSDNDKLVAMLGNPAILKTVARGCYEILTKRNDIVYFSILQDVINIIDETVFNM